MSKEYARPHPWDEALRLATHVEIELHATTALVNGGCPATTAARPTHTPGTPTVPKLTITMGADALCHLDCRIARIFQVSDHTLITGTVAVAASGEASMGALREPPVYFDRTLHELGLGWR